MWNLSYSSKRVTYQHQYDNYQKHLQNLRKMRSTFKSFNSPAKFSVVYNNRKKTLQSQQKELEIKSSNRILLRKMMNIKEAVDHKLDRPYSRSALSATYTKMNRAIQLKNIELMNRIESVKSDYASAKILTQTVKLSQIKDNISENARRTGYTSLTNLQKSRRSSLGKSHKDEKSLRSIYSKN